MNFLSNKSPRSLVLIAAVSLLCGCAGIPKEQLAAYVASVSEAKLAGQTMLTDWRSARAELERRESTKKITLAPPPAPFPLTRPLPKGGEGAPLSSEDARMLAWEAIAEYTAALARLNAGESVDDVKKTAGRMFDLATKIAGSSFPGGDALVTALKELAGQIEQARLAAEFKKAIRAGAPVVKAIINQYLLKDIANHYGLRAALAAEDHAAVDFEPNLSDDDKKLKKTRILDETTALFQTLDSYEALLKKTSASLEAIEKAVDRPIDFAAEANRLFDIASELKKEWSAYEAARKEGRK